MKKSILLSFISLVLFSVTANAAQRNFTMTFTQLHERCLRYPENTDLAPKSFISANTLVKTVRQCTAVNHIMLRNNSSWLEGDSLFNQSVPEFAPFVQKLLVKPESTIIFLGDLHGNIHSLMRILNELYQQKIIDHNFHIIKPDAYLVFLGDYVDRGQYGIEVIYTLMRLRLANPYRIFLVRGNHEDLSLNKRYGFEEELFTRTGITQENLKMLQQWYTTMPLALFIGVDNGKNIDFIQSCHGGPEMGFNASALLQANPSVQFQHVFHLDRADHVRNLPISLKHDVLQEVPENEIENIILTSPTRPVTNGLMWSDVIEDIRNYTSPIISFNKGRGWVYGQELTKYLLKQQSSSTHRLHAIMRGHQHYGSMLEQLIAHKGLVNLWNNTVYTVLSAPMPGKSFPYDAFTLVKTGVDYAHWTVEPHVVH